MCILGFPTVSDQCVAELTLVVTARSACLSVPVRACPCLSVAWIQRARGVPPVTSWLVSGYSPLHIAMMFGHEEIFNLLVKVYSGDPNLRDWSGRKPRHYLASRDTSVSADTFRKLKARRKQSEKDLGFLRIGSLNVRVKKTTEAFSNFLGVGAVQTNERLHKTWGSADNIQQVGSDAMPPPKFAPQKKRRSKQGPDARESYSTPNTPPSLGRASVAGSAGDSDSDNACGFDAGWKCPA
ncbi:uncharacterized protein LOC134538142 [Bacillus rossius redtenbacheri]|uniref:uncharacterized protein LOC134538142 n=1 Tax=Bacillus rossius redtenbacheri TaxID=93214 RepID=UPI002FDE090F